MAKSLAAQLKLKTEPRNKKGKKPKKDQYEQFFFNKPEMVETDSYIPPAGDWDEENVVYTFEDGWTINECLTRYDIRLVAYLTRTCVGSYIVRGPNFDKKAFIEEARKAAIAYHEKSWEYAVHLTKEQKQAKIDQAMKRFTPRLPTQRIFRLTDPKGRPRCMILTTLADLPKEQLRYAHYSSCRDLGEQEPMVVDGMRLVLNEARIGTGAEVPKHAKPYLLEWYKSCIDGEWDEEKYQAAKPRRWAAYGNASAAPDRENLKTDAEYAVMGY